MAIDLPTERFIYHLDTGEIIRFENEILAMKYTQALKQTDPHRWQVCGISAFLRHAQAQIDTSKKPGAVSCWECGRIYTGRECPACGESED